MNARQATVERAGFWLLSACLGVVQFNLLTAQVLFGLSAICWLVVAVGDGRRPTLPAFALPLGLYGGWTLLSAAMSSDPAASLADCKQLVLFLIVPVVARLARGRRAMTTIDIIMALGAIGALVGIVEFTMLGYDDLNKRPEGLLTHYMTYSGVLMLVTCTAAARLLFYPQQRIWPGVAMPALLVALALTLTQNAWVGTLVALACLVAIRRPKLLLFAPLIIGLAFLVAPAEVRSRATSGFSPETESNRDRLQMLAMGTNMVRDHPVFGVGPEMVRRVYGRYLRPNTVHTSNPHLHNVPMQIAAERGLPALGLFLWFIVAAVIDSRRQIAKGPFRAVAGAALGGIIAMLAAGLFEYNFGDSEFLMLLLGLLTLPFAARSDEGDRGDALPMPALRREGAPALSAGAPED